MLGRVHADIGGGWFKTRVRAIGNGYPYKGSRIYQGNPPYTVSYTGRLYAAIEVRNVLQFADETSLEREAQRVTAKVPPASNSNLDAMGTTAIARVAPTDPRVDLATTLAELYREGLPQTPGKGGNVGGEYLNVQFGVLPLAGAAQDFVRVARESDELLKQLERDSGRWIRRQYTFPEEVTSTEATFNNRVPAPVGGSISGSLAQLGTLRVTTQTRTKTWFSGAFTYHLPKSGWRRTAAELDYLYGVVPGVDTVYQLTPWSWLADYFSNAGDVVSNLNAFGQDGLVMPYGYVMRSSTSSVTYRWTGPLWVGNSFSVHTIEDTLIWDVKQRRRATPFGFGFSGELSPKQLSILAALGISRM